MCSFEYTAVAVSEKFRSLLSALTSPVGWLSSLQLTEIDVIEVLMEFCVVTLLFEVFGGYKGFCHMTDSNLFLILFNAPGSNDRGHIVFVRSVCLSVCLFVCLSVINFNLHYNFWTVRDRDFIFGMHTPLMMPFQMIARSMTLWPWLRPWS